MGDVIGATMDIEGIAARVERGHSCSLHDSALLLAEVLRLRRQLAERDAELQYLRSQAGPDSDADVTADLRRQLAAARDCVRGLSRRLEAAWSEIDDLRRQLAEAQAERLEIARALGIVFQADGHGDEPGPLDATLRAIREDRERASRAEGRSRG